MLLKVSHVVVLNDIVVWPRKCSRGVDGNVWSSDCYLRHRMDIIARMRYWRVQMRCVHWWIMSLGRSVVVMMNSRGSSGLCGGVGRSVGLNLSVRWSRC